MGGEGKSHSIVLDLDKCRGCTNCLQRCPTEAIRVRNGRAYILDERCIDCGQCVRTCPSQAKQAVSHSLDIIKDYEVSIALVAPSFYGQFPGSLGVNRILSAVKSLGFADVLEVAQGADRAARGAEEILREENRPRPLITSSCPVVVRLIQNRFPSLLDQLIPLISPMEITARIARTLYPGKNRGVFFISPCSGKLTAVNHPRGLEKSGLDGVIGFRDIYGAVKSALSRENFPEEERLASAPSSGRRWARVGGEGEDSSDHFISIDGIDRVMEGLEKIENGGWERFELVEFMCCPGGCLGGPLTVVNPYEGAAHMKERERLKDPDPSGLRQLPTPPGDIRWEKAPEPLSVYQLDGDYGKAVVLMEEMEEILAELPGIDCGSCGAPTCQAFAEDVVTGRADINGCVFMLREKIKGLTDQMVDLQRVMPPSFRKKDEDE
ncbi:MAG: [Fe-Fe] hydrogenase large subunit C-terminal domain-containing protein [Spirochaetales bacterium]|nr:[Fe-Fe] hydrogenase large subunit C-terminal domain-containing protein [Spirochaetales bacterium]